MAEKVEASIVLVDVGPSSGTLNQMFIMSCDYILPPTFVDYLSIHSSSGLLNTVLPNWYNWREQTVAAQHIVLTTQPGIRADTLRFAMSARPPPRILPFLVTGTRVRRYPRTGGVPRATLHASRWLRTLRRIAEEAPEDMQARYIRATTTQGETGMMVICVAKEMIALIQQAQNDRTAPVLINDETGRDMLKRYMRLASSLDRLDKHPT
jgi:hypothetical protein